MSTPGAEGAAAEAIRDAEAALARQHSVTERVDVEVVSAVRGAHVAHDSGTAALECLQREIEAALAARAGLDSPAGAREVQRYLIDRLNDIRSVVDKINLDDDAKAKVATALAELYGAPSSMEPALDEASPIADVGPLEFPGPAPVDATGQPPLAEPAQPTPPPAVPPIPAIPSLSGGMPGVPLGGLASLPGLAALADPPGDPAVDLPSDPPADSPSRPEDPPDPGYADVIAEAVAGTPIADAFDHQGISIPDPGTPVGAPLDAGQVVAGDIAVFGDRHALALGNGKALLDGQIQPIESIDRPGFLGWQHPPRPIAEPD